MKTKINYYKILKFILIPVNLLLILTFLLNYFHLLPAFWKSIYVFYFALLINTGYIALKIKPIPNNEREDHKVVYLSKYFFLLSLIILAINQFLKRQIIVDNLSYIIGLSIAFGFLTFYSSKDKLETYLDEENKGKEVGGKRKLEFPTKFLRINKVPILRNLIKWMYKEGWVYSIELIGVYIVFATIQVYKIYTTGIGTDEGNFLYTAKLILQGNTLYLNFWARESGSLIFLIPWFKIFEISIINLRWFVFLIHTVIFIIFYLFLRKISNNKKANLIILLLSIIILQFNADLDIFQGIFYQIGSLFSILIPHLSYKYYLSKSNFPHIFLIGILTGLAIFSYKGLQIFLVIIPVIIIFKNREIEKNTIGQTLAFFISTLVPITIYWVYYSLKTDFFHIYNVILEDIFFNIGILLLMFLIINIFLIRKQLKNLLQKNFLIILTNIAILLAIIYSLIREPERLFFSFYSGVFLGFPFLIFLLQSLNLYSLDVYRKALSLSYALFNILVLIFGYGSRGFFTQVPEYYHIIATVFTSLYTIYLIIYGFSLTKNRTFEDGNKWLLVLIFNLWFVISIVGAYLMPVRFQTILIFLPLIFVLISSIKIRYKYLFYFILFIGLLFSISINLNLSNDYTFYSYKEFEESISYMQNNFSGATVFSLDTAILASINNKNLILVHSPFHLREEEDIYFYDGLKDRYTEYDISLTKSEMLEKLEEERPEVIFGAYRSTLRIFDDKDLGEFLEENYEEEINLGRIRIYKLLS